MNRPIKEIMTGNVHSIREEDTLMNAIKIIKRHHIRHLPVVKNNTVVGMLSSNDINRLTFSNIFTNERETDEAILEMLTIPQVMSARPKVVQANASIREVAEIFASEHFHSLPVVEDGKLAGIVTTTDIIKYMLAQD